MLSRYFLINAERYLFYNLDMNNIIEEAMK